MYSVSYSRRKSSESAERGRASSADAAGSRGAETDSIWKNIRKTEGNADGNQNPVTDSAGKKMDISWDLMNCRCKSFRDSEVA